MKYERFEQLPVWKEAIKMAAEVLKWSAKPVFKNKGGLANQLQRASISISNNIAEGFERGTTKELITFLYYARGSAGEVRSMLCMMELMAEFDEMKEEIEKLKKTAEIIARQIRAWAQSLQDSKIKGQRYLIKQTQEKECKNLKSET